jgi:hypothetical protein
MEDREQRMKEVEGIAAALEKHTGCPAQLLIAQSGHFPSW